MVDMMTLKPKMVQDATPSWQPPNASSGPNVITVVFDDTGWSDFGCFGSEVGTPNIDRLAKGGLRYNNFHVTPLCSPTRSCLLTGRNHHSVGMRFLADVDSGFDNSRGRVHPDVPTIPSMLKANGYGTYLAGKWHLTPYHELTAAGPFDNWPLARGFERFYGILDGCSDQYCPELYRDNQQVPGHFPPDYHMSEDIVGEAIGWLSSHASFRSSSPFYLQLAFGATHSPLQVPKRYVDKYIKVFEKGWDATRQDRLERQVSDGLVPLATQLTPRPDDVAAWENLSDDERRLFVMQQATFAGFLEHTDEQIGRLVTALTDLGLFEDTLIAVFSDNGAVLEGGPVGSAHTVRHFGGFPQTAPEQLDMLENEDIGGRNRPAHYPKGWGMAGNTPFRRFKQFVDLGGVRSPLVVSWPRAISASRTGGICTDFVHVIDLAATIADVAGCNTDELHGKSIAPGLKGSAQSVPRSSQYWEMMGRRAVWHEGWRAIAEHVPGTSYGNDVWTLFDGNTDFAERIDVAARFPDKLEQLKQVWEQQAAAFDVFPLDDRPFLELLKFRSPLVNTDRMVLKNGCGHMPAPGGMCGTNRPMTVTAKLNPASPGGDGIIVSSGNYLGGYVLYVSGGKLVFEHRCNGEHVRGAATASIPPSAGSLGFALRRNGLGADVTLLVDDQPMAEIPLKFVSHHLSFWGLDIGRCGSNPVSDHPDAARPYGLRGLVEVDFQFLNEAELKDTRVGRE
jgi:arylsulfatase A-like enzyme